MDEDRVKELLGALRTYRAARLALLDVLDLPVSNRDPLAEWSEHLVTALLGGELASSRVQRDWDLTAPDGAHVQVKYLANASAWAGIWVNEHLVVIRPGVDKYALVPRRV